jgi:hypothetical protein
MHWICWPWLWHGCTQPSVPFVFRAVSRIFALFPTFNLSTGIFFHHQKLLFLQQRETGASCNAQVFPALARPWLPMQFWKGPGGQPLLQFWKHPSNLNSFPAADKERKNRGRLAANHSDWPVNVTPDVPFEIYNQGLRCRNCTGPSRGRIGRWVFTRSMYHYSKNRTLVR